MSDHHTEESRHAGRQGCDHIEEQLLKRIDRLVAQRRFPTRSQAIQEAVRDKLDRLDGGRLSRECAKLNRSVEQKMADEGLDEDFAEWPDF
jgi:Arc/MetJ-type ribon-helix-helix transcriptional regulator